MSHATELHSTLITTGTDYLPNSQVVSADKKN